MRRPPIDDRNGTRSASRADHWRLAGHRHRRSVQSARGAGRPGERGPVPGAICQRGAGGRVGGDHGLAVRGRGAAPDQSRCASGRARGHRRAARSQATCQERPRRCPSPARAVDGRPAARVLDRAGAHPRSARPRPVAPHAVRAARRVAAADPVSPLSPWLPAARRSAQPRRIGVVVCPAAGSQRTRAGSPWRWP